MNNGIYYVTFSSNGGSFGEGIAVFKDGSVNGGDSGYLYKGNKSEQGGKFSSSLTVQRWNQSAQSVFGSINQFVLELTGSSSADKGFLATGHVAGQPQATITIRGRYLSDAA